MLTKAEQLTEMVLIIGSDKRYSEKLNQNALSSSCLKSILSSNLALNPVNKSHHCEEGGGVSIPTQGLACLFRGGDHS